VNANNELKIQEQQLVEINVLRWQLKDANRIINTIREGEIESKEQSRELHDINMVLEDEATQRQAVQEVLQGLNIKLEDEAGQRQVAQEVLQGLNIKLEDEAGQRQVAQEALQELNIKLEDEATQRQAAQEALQELNIKLEDEATQRQAAQEALQELNTKLEDEATQRQAAQEALQELNIKLEDEATQRQAAQEALQELNTKLEDEATQRQAAQEALQELNTKLKDEATQRQAAQKALQDLNIKLEDEATQLQAAQDALQDLNIKLEDEATQRQAAQEALQDLNLGLENIVAERTSELQDINTILEEEIMERQVAQDELAGANAHLETRVQERTIQLQEINATLEEEIIERQATENALQESRDALLVREQQLEYYADEVVATNTELKSFVNTIAHDFRSPMVNLMGFSTELGNSLAELKKIVGESASFLPQEVQMKVNDLLEKDVSEAQTFIKSAVTRLSRMVDALLNLSRLGRREMRYEEVDMSKLVNTIVESFKHQITEQHIQIEVRTLPKIKIDYLVVEQIMGNLVDNAIKYLDPSRPGKIESSCTENENEYVVSVKDNGRGIHETDCEKIFDLFRRSGNQDQPGEGMGLAYVRALIRKLGGKVWCQSVLGVGTQISFSLPKIPRFH